MQQDFSCVEADVLIIGGGSAGAMAAIRAKEVNPNQKVVVLEKGNIQYSGCIARGMDALNIVAIPGLDTPELYVESNRIACQGVMDEPQALVMAERSWELMQKLESWDVCFPTDARGNYELLQVHPKGKFAATMKEVFKSTFSTDVIERWLKKAELDEEVRAYIREKTEQFKAH